MNEQRVVYFAGHVQGVGFRYTTKQISARYAVTGFVRNLPDGRVHVVAEGTSQEIDAFLSNLESTMANNIDEVISESVDATNEFESFSVRY